MQNEELIHDWMISHLAHRLSRDYTDIKTNIGDDRRNEFKGRYPDLILANHGMVLAIMEVETDGTISPQQAMAQASQILVDHFSLINQTFSAPPEKPKPAREKKPKPKKAKKAVKSKPRRK